jgi:hypothetical protein
LEWRPPGQTVPMQLPNVWMLDVDRDERGWCLVSLTDGKRRVVSRHPSKADAEAAKDVMNAASQPGTGGSNDPTRARPPEVG